MQVERDHDHSSNSKSVKSVTRGKQVFLLSYTTLKHKYCLHPKRQLADERQVVASSEEVCEIDETETMETPVITPYDGALLS